MDTSVTAAICNCILHGHLRFCRGHRQQDVVRTRRRAINLLLTWRSHESAQQTDVVITPQTTTGSAACCGPASSARCAMRDAMNKPPLVEAIQAAVPLLQSPQVPARPCQHPIHQWRHSRWRSRHHSESAAVAGPRATLMAASNQHLGRGCTDACGPIAAPAICSSGSGKLL
jgi:hypothetical protein